MITKEAIEYIEALKNSDEILDFYYAEEFIEAFEMAIKALEKEMPKKVGEQYINGYGNTKAECLTCHCTVIHPSNYCKFCGQRLDWSEEE